MGYAIFYEPNEKIPLLSVVGWFIGSSLGVYFTGEFAYDGGSFFYTCMGGLVGTSIGILGAPIREEGSGYYLLFGTLLGEVIGYHLSTDKIEISEKVTVSFFPRTAAKAQIPNALPLLQIDF